MIASTHIHTASAISLSAHIILLISLLLYGNCQPQKPVRCRVQTVHLSPPTTTIKPSEPTAHHISAHTEQKTPTAHKIHTQQKPQQTKTQQTNTPKKTARNHTKTRQTESTHITSIFASLDRASACTQQTRHQQTNHADMNIDTSEYNLQALYEDLLVQTLRQSLRLPESGEATVTLTLTRSGTVSAINVIACHNKTIRNRITTTVPSLCFPPFGSQFPGEQTHTFTLKIKQNA